MRNRLAVGLAVVGLGLGVSHVALAADLQLERVMLSTGGVGYFEYEATVAGDASLTLDVPLDQVDDILKSLVVFDDKGGIGGVELPGQQPMDQLFRDLPFGPEALSSPVALLNALQGSDVIATGARTLTGRLLNVAPEVQALPNGGGTVTRHRLTMLTTEGLQQLVLEQADSVKFADPALQAQVDKALRILAESHARDRRSLTITANGTGSRKLRVAYVTEAPLWKTSYRLTMPAAADAESARLQGWAVIENMSGQDWKDVDLTLVSGSPVTFRQALYASYYIDRQEVPVEVVGRILPNVDTGASAYEVAAEAAPAGGGAADYMRPDRARTLAAGALGDVPPPPPPVMAAPAPMPEAAYKDVESTIVAGGSTTVASTEALTQVVFHLEQPVSVTSGRSLSVPIVDRDVKASRLALYQPGVHAQHPLASVRLTNDGDTGLPPGILTLYEKGADGFGYVGDARLSVLPAGDDRMISYALDQKVRLDRAESSDSVLQSGSIARGIFNYTRVQKQVFTYKIAAPPREDRSMVLELPKLAGYDMVQPAEGVEETDRYWRIPVTLEAGKTRTVEITAQRTVDSAIAIGGLSDSQLAYYAAAEAVDAKTRKAFEQLAKLKSVQVEADRKVGDLTGRMRDLTEEQSRLRDNLQAVPRDSDIYRRYLDKLDDQETAIETLQAQIAEGKDASVEARKAVEDFIARL